MEYVSYKYSSSFLLKRCSFWTKRKFYNILLLNSNYGCSKVKKNQILFDNFSQSKSAKTFVVKTLDGNDIWSNNLKLCIHMLPCTLKPQIIFMMLEHTIKVNNTLKVRACRMACSLNLF
jgi:hypothetical protein